MTLRVAVIAVAASLLAATAQAASAAVPRAGYWTARIGRSGPMVGMLVADSRRQIATTVGRMDVQCPDRHTHTINFGAPNVPINSTGAFAAEHSGPPDEFDHPGLDGWHFGGIFTSSTRASGTVHLLWTGEGEACTAPKDRTSWTGRWRAEPVLTATPAPVHQGGLLTLRGRGYLPKQTVHIELPNRVGKLGTVEVLQQRLKTRANSSGRFRVVLRVPRQMKTKGLWRAQAWQLECTTTCWVHADSFYRVAPA